ncbi:hypothetical protein ACWDFL_05500 [Streptomyces bungoensis]
MRGRKRLGALAGALGVLLALTGATGTAGAQSAAAKRAYPSAANHP